MVFKYLSGGANGDLNNATDFGGFYNDTVLVADANTYTIYTYEGADIIDASRPIGGNFNVNSGSGNDTIIGGSINDNANGGSGNDKLSLGGGDDIAVISKGNDIADGGAGSDYIYFTYQNFDGYGNAGAIIDNTKLNATGATFDLAITVAQTVAGFGTLTAKNFENLIGSNGSDKFSGNSAMNLIQGLKGDDILIGRAGDDTLEGGLGRDTYNGGTGRDVIYLNETTAARDILKYTSMADSGLSAFTTADAIYSFDKGGAATADKIDLSAIDADASQAGNQAFIYRGAGAFSSATGEVRLEVIAFDTIIHVDSDADASDEMTILVSGVTGLTAVDFVL